MTIIRAIAGGGWYGLLVLAAAAAATGGTWIYGFWKSPTLGLVFLPIGVVVFFAAVGALAAPIVTAVLVAVAALTMADQGLTAAVILGAKVFLGFGVLSFGWKLWRAKWRGP